MYQIWKKKNNTARLPWHLDETYIRGNREWCYLYLATNKDRHTFAIHLHKKRGHEAAYAFLKRFVKTFGEPMALTTDQAPTLLCAFKKLRQKGFYKHDTHYTIKHQNNLIGQDHKHIKRRLAKSAGFQNAHLVSRIMQES